MKNDEEETGRRLGEAISPGEERLESILRSVPAWRGEELKYSPVSGGISNSNWRISIAGKPKQYFLKIPGEGSEKYVDRTASHQASRRAGDLGIGPEVVSIDGESGVEIIEFLEGYRACTTGDLKNLNYVHELINVYRQFHKTELLSTDRTILGVIDSYIHQIEDLKIELPVFARRVLDEYKSASSAILASGLDLVPCHNDPMPGNILIGANRPMKLIDYEFASNNDRAYELAVLVTEMFYDDAAIDECVEDYYGSLDWSVLSRVHVFAALADVNWGLWACMKRSFASTWDFDFSRYGIWKLNRARIKMNDVRWGNWLASL